MALLRPWERTVDEKPLREHELKTETVSELWIKYGTLINPDRFYNRIWHDDKPWLVLQSTINNVWCACIIRDDIHLTMLLSIWYVYVYNAMSCRI